MSMHSFHRGSPALDFVGTLGYRESSPQERLPNAAAFATWLRESRLMARVPALTQENFQYAIELREAAASVLGAVADGLPLSKSAVGMLNRAAASMPAPKLDPKSGERVVAKDLASALARIAADAISVATDDRDRLVRCDLEECRALLLSSTAGERRKWCSMDRCGNLAKVRAYRRRHARES